MNAEYVTDKAIALIKAIHSPRIGAKEFTGGWSPERVDAILFCSNSSYLIETKISRSDFFADAKKPFRQNPASGIGKYRYYACPVGLIKPDELPEKWGLIYVEEGRSRASMPVGYGGALIIGQQKSQYGWNENIYRHFGSTYPDTDPNQHWEHHYRARKEFAFDERSHEIERQFLYAMCTRYRDKKFMGNML